MRLLSIAPSAVPVEGVARWDHSHGDPCQHCFRCMWLFRLNSVLDAPCDLCTLSSLSPRPLNQGRPAR